MNAQEELLIKSLDLKLSSIALELAKQREEAAQRNRHEDLPEWITLDQAIAKKGAPALITARGQKRFQPCLGYCYHMVGGRRCWARQDVLEWLSVTDENLSEYEKQIKERIA